MNQVLDPYKILVHYFAVIGGVAHIATDTAQSAIGCLAWGGEVESFFSIFLSALPFRIKNERPYKEVQDQYGRREKEEYTRWEKSWGWQT